MESEEPPKKVLTHISHPFVLRICPSVERRRQTRLRSVPPPSRSKMTENQRGSRLQLQRQMPTWQMSVVKLGQFNKCQREN